MIGVYKSINLTHSHSVCADDVAMDTMPCSV